MVLYGPKQENRLISRLLPERSYLYYKYPQKNNDYAVEFYLPILENIEVSESQRPNLGTYDLLGRAGNLFSYHGAKSREFSLKFYITLPHLVEYIVNYGMNEQFTDSFRFFSNDRDEEKRRFFTAEVRGSYSGQTLGGTNRFFGGTDITKGNTNKDLYYNEALKTYSKLLPPKSELEQIIEEFNILGNQLFKLPVLEGLGDILNIFRIERPKVLKNAISYLMLMINVVRTSTLNNAKNTSLGPPTIYLNHGSMYNNIPCICTNYSLRLVSENGYDLKTMTPRRIEVSLSLSENRTGDFDAFIPFNFVKGENLAGWEAVIENRTLDPWNSTFGSWDADWANLAAWEKANGDIQYDSEYSIGPPDAPPVVDTTDTAQYFNNNITPRGFINDDPVIGDTDPLGVLDQPRGFTPTVAEVDQYSVANKSSIPFGPLGTPIPPVPTDVFPTTDYPMRIGPEPANISNITNI